MNVTIETERLILRNLRESDLDNMFKLDSNPIVHKYLGNKPFTCKSQSIDYIEDILRQYKINKIGRWAVIEKATGVFVGWSGLRKYSPLEMFNNHVNFYDVGYRLLPEYWGKGYATESGKRAIHYGFNTLKLNTIYGITEKGNMASHKALLKIGLSYVEDFYYEKEAMCLRWYAIKK